MSAASREGEKRGGGGREEMLSHEGDCLHCHSSQVCQLLSALSIAGKPTLPIAAQ